jgi:RHS repeat-associated protein
VTWRNSALVSQIAFTNSGALRMTTTKTYDNLNRLTSISSGGWNPTAEINGTNNAVIRGYMWGSDLSGTVQGAGGAGGLLTDSSSRSAHFTCFDGNGNIAALVDTTLATASAQYEYGPFGELIRATGQMARSNPLRFSTKYQDDESDLVYYGWRYLMPSAGTWLSRDPAEEEGGPNPYGFIGNDPVNDFDELGLVKWEDLEALRDGLDELLKNRPCCCTAKPPTKVVLSITGTPSGATVTDELTIEKHGCVIGILHIFWWDCFTAQKEGGALWDIFTSDPNAWKQYGWYAERRLILKHTGVRLSLVTLTPTTGIGLRR